MGRKTKLAALCLGGWAAARAAPASAQVVAVLHSFQGGANDGWNPQGSLIISGSALFGMTVQGGPTGGGTLFRIGTDGSSFGVLHFFPVSAGSGYSPMGSLVQSGSTLFGLASAGGSHFDGAVFMIGADGTGFSMAHVFAGGPGDGAAPLGSLALSGTTLYGLTSEGGSVLNTVSGLYSNGTVFQIGTNGTGESLLNSFGGPNDGRMPGFGAPVVSGNSLYGTTVSDVNSNAGIIFAVGTDGTGYTVLHRFGGSVGGDGAGPGQPILVGNTLYGMTGAGGSNNDGTIYKINIDGTGYAVLHNFTGGPNDGLGAGSELALVGSTLYGMTNGGGADALGTIFGINTDGSDFQIEHSFAGGATDGAGPVGDLTVSGSTFYGMTSGGGSGNEGVIFSFPIPVPEPSSLMLAAGGFTALFAGRRAGREGCRPGSDCV